MERLLTQRGAAQQMGVTERWVRSLVADWKERGDIIVVHGLTGRESKILGQPEWQDFGPTFAAEQLAKRHEVVVSKETLRGWMIAARRWESRSRKPRKVHPWRARRSGYGDLVQWDTSDHDWLEGRGERVRHLVRMIDDATSRGWGRFVEHDGTRENMGVPREYVLRAAAEGREPRAAAPGRPGRDKRGPRWRRLQRALLQCWGRLEESLARPPGDSCLLRPRAGR